MADRPNILLIMTDQQSSTMLSCAGNPYVSTPAMDSIAAEGVRFDRAYCTNPLCAPSRFSLMTGRMPSEIGLKTNNMTHIQAIPESIKSNALGNRLRQAGYETVYAGKVHLPRMTAADVGFDHICADMRQEMAEACARYLAVKRDRPFCLVASFINPHDIGIMGLRKAEVLNEADQKILRTTPEQVAALEAALARPAGVDDATFFAKYCPPLPPNFEPGEDDPQVLKVGRVRKRPYRTTRHGWSEQTWREHRWAYARLTEAVDRQVGCVLEGLREGGQADQTLVVFTSDHGDMDGAHKLEGKCTFYEEACRIPLIIRPPGGARPGRVDQTHLVSNGLDILPTLCDWAGADCEAKAPGRSLRKLVEGDGREPWRQSLGIECFIGRAVVTERFKYARYELAGNEEQLLDLVADPFEQRNVLNDPGCKEAVARLRVIFGETFSM